MNIGLKRGNVELRDYNPEWISEFETEVKILKKILPQDIGPFEHIGSTAIPGMRAKPIIDFMAGISSVAKALEYEPVLLALGYTHRSNGDNEDRVLFVKGPEDCRSHHLSFVTRSSDQWNRSIGFRDLLSSNRDLAERYINLKTELAQQHPQDRYLYTEAKQPFFEEVFEIIAMRGNN